MKITKFGLEILWRAKYYHDQDCKEKKEKRGGKSVEVLYCNGAEKTFYGLATNESYCAAFISQVIKDTLEQLGRKLNFTFGHVNVASLHGQAKGHLTINKIPRPGAVAIIKSGITTKVPGHSHAMIVRDVSEDNKYFSTYEGNAEQGGEEGVLSIVQRPSSKFTLNDYDFIHIQDYFSDMRDLVDNQLATFKPNNKGDGNNYKKQDYIIANLISVRNEYR